MVVLLVLLPVVLPVGVLLLVGVLVGVLGDPDLGVDVQDAGAACFHHLVDGVDLGAVEVAVVLAVLQEAARLHVHLHLLPRGEVVRVAVQLVVTWTPGRD